MPIYEFYCRECQKSFDELCSAEDSSKIVCPSCGRAAQKKISGFAFKSGSSFKSSGGGCSSCSGGTCSTCGH